MLAKPAVAIGSMLLSALGLAATGYILANPRVPTSEQAFRRAAPSTLQTNRTQVIRLDDWVIMGELHPAPGPEATPDLPSLCTPPCPGRGSVSAEPAKVEVRERCEPDAHEPVPGA